VCKKVILKYSQLVFFVLFYKGEKRFLKKTLVNKVIIVKQQRSNLHSRKYIHEAP